MPKLSHQTTPLLTQIGQLERMRRDFVANVSHELRTPLTVIRGYLETLQNKNQDENLSPVYQQMLEHSIRMENIIEDLLLLSRLESETVDQEPLQTIDVEKLLQRLVDQANAISGDKQHLLILNADSNLRLNAIEDELSSLFSNLIINAVKYTPAHGNIQINWQQVDGQAVFQVIDTGIGIEQKHLPRITERFYRVDKARSRESGGTGLGLAIVKHVLAKYDARLKIESQLGKGSTFTCYF